MKKICKRPRVLWGVLAVLALCGTAYPGEPLKVFILAGQSNMEGHGKSYITATETVGTLEYMAINDPDNYGHIMDGGDFVVRDDVWCHYLRLDGTLESGNLTVGFGVKNNVPADVRIGPEYQFGFVLGDLYNAPVLIIKCAWGGRSLGNDFRPPSSGWPKTPEAYGDAGYYYQQIIDRVNDFKANPASYCVAYDPADGYEIVGFGWHQGWNDRVDSTFSAEYEVNMKNFIRDIRFDLGIPNLPFSISTTGMAPPPAYTEVELAQLEMENFTKYPDFEGSVAVDDTRPYWRDASESPSSFGFHWNHNGESYYLVGKGMGQGMVDLLGVVDPNAPAVDAGVDKITWSSQPVTMDPNIVEVPGSTWTDLTYDWQATPSEAVTFSPNSTVKNPDVTITKSTSNPSQVILILEVNDQGRTELGVIDTLRIDVYDTACKAAVGIGISENYPPEIDGNCVIDLADFAIIAGQWLVDGKLGSAQKM